MVLWHQISSSTHCSGTVKNSRDYLEHGFTTLKQAVKTIGARVIDKRIHARLNTYADLVVVGEVADGLEAVVQAQTLQPDVILMSQYAARIACSHPFTSSVRSMSFPEEVNNLLQHLL